MRGAYFAILLSFPPPSNLHLPLSFGLKWLWKPGTFLEYSEKASLPAFILPLWAQSVDQLSCLRRVFFTGQSCLYAWWLHGMLETK